MSERPRFRLDLGEILYFTDHTCRTCGEAPTHFLVQPKSPEKWLAQKWMEVIAVPYCDPCSPAALEVPPRPLPEPTFWQSLWKRILTA